VRSNGNAAVAQQRRISAVRIAHRDAIGGTWAIGLADTRRTHRDADAAPAAGSMVDRRSPDLQRLL
jgi:hypothetical protein